MSGFAQHSRLGVIVEQMSVEQATALDVDPLWLLAIGLDLRESRWESPPEVENAVRGRHVEITSAAVSSYAGTPLPASSDAPHQLFRFDSGSGSISAALAVQRAHAQEPWPSGTTVAPRIGVHCALVARANTDVPPTHAGRRCSQVAAVAHGGQTLLTSAARSAAEGTLPDGAWLSDLGIQRLRDLMRADRVFQLGHPDISSGQPPPLSLDAIPNNLPGQLTSFVGREGEMAAVQRLLSTHRLVTLAGAGGCGKTRLAAQAVAEVVDRWPDGVWWVDLGSFTDPDRVIAVTAAAAGVTLEPATDAVTALTAELADQRVLLCLDTCEHMLGPSARLVDVLLRACPAASVLATSREPLGVVGEVVWRVPSLPTPEAEQLFAERAALATGGQTDLTADSPSVAAICQRLDGIPLAIELAAGWMRTLTPAQIAAGLDGRMQRQPGGSHIASPRQQTLAASIQWSHDLLDDPDRVVLRRLSVFAGGFDVGAARSVCADDGIPPETLLERLMSLVDKSLLMPDGGPDEARYRLLDTVRQYAADRLLATGERAASRELHLDHFLELAERAEPELDKHQDTWRARLEEDHDNLQVALEFGLSLDDPERGRRLAAALARFWFISGSAHEGIAALRRAIERSPAERTTLQARLWSGLAMLGMISGRFQLSETAAARGLDLAVACRDDRSRARCLLMQAYRWYLFDFDRCHRLAIEALEAGMTADDPFTRDWALVQDAYTYVARDRHDESTALARQALANSEPRGDRFCAAFAQGVLLWAAMTTGQLRRAVQAGTESRRLAKPLGDFFALGTNTVNLALATALLGDIEGAQQLTEPVIRSLESTPDVDAVGFMVVAGTLHLFEGNLEESVTWFERGQRFAAPDLENWTAIRSMPGLAGALRRLGRHAEAQEVADRGVLLARAFDGPLQLAQAIDEQAFLAAEDDDHHLAETLHHKALAVRLERGLRTQYVDSLDALSSCAIRAERHEEGVRLVAASDAARAVMEYPRQPVDVPDHTERMKKLRGGLPHDSFDVSWREGASLDLDEAVAYARRARGSRNRPASGWESLTPTEVAVVRLVVEGLTNPQIGARLFVSRSTVKTHLSHVFTKVGVTGRTDLVRYAVGHLAHADL